MASTMMTIYFTVKVNLKHQRQWEYNRYHYDLHAGIRIGRIGISVLVAESVILVDTGGDHSF